MMASHGRRGIGALLLGSDMQKVLTYSTLPVLVWRLARPALLRVLRFLVRRMSPAKVRASLAAVLGR